jgi:hypothetical protein
VVEISCSAITGKEILLKPIERKGGRVFKHWSLLVGKKLRGGHQRD